MKTKISTLLMLFLLGVAGIARADDKGTITGHVTDKRTGHAIPFASVAVPAAKTGGLTDSEGLFTVKGVPTGTYEVKVQYLGYKPFSANATVLAGKTVVLDFKIEDVVVHEEKAVEVSAERRLVEVKQGATMRSVGANDIRNMAVTTVSDVLQQQAGVSTDAEQIHIRGGRSDETVFVVNGVANRDLVTGQSTAGQLNARSVAEVNVATGAYDVRYGNALSGVVEIKLKEGTDKFALGLTSSSGSYGGRAWQIVATGPDKVWTPVMKLMGLTVEPGSVSNVFDVSSSLFETRFRYLYPNNQPSFIESTILPPLHPRLHSGYEDSFFGIKFKYPDSFSPAEDNRWAARYGLFWKPNTADKLSFNFSKRIAIDQGFSRTFITTAGTEGDPSYPWRWNNRIDHGPTIFEDNVQSSLQWRRTLKTSGYFDVQLSRYYFAQHTDVQGKNWADYVEPDDRSLPLGDPRRDDYFYDTGDNYLWQDTRTNSVGLQSSWTQRYHRNEIEMGLEHQFQTVQYVTIEYPWVFDKDGLGQSHDLWKAHPWTGDLYLRDRLEFEGFTANVGIRGDYWFVGREAEQALADTSRHNIASSTRDQFFSDTHSFFGRRFKAHVSPRIIVAHPISETSSFFFNYGEFTQNPSYRYVYSKLNSISSESFPLQGNPNLNPQVSVNYEVGAKDQFLPGVAANMTFFVRDVYDYPTSTRVDPTSGTNLQSYFIYLNGHFARSKGYEIEIEKRRSHHWSGKVSYSYQQTKGKSSDPNEEKALQQIGGSSETRLSSEFVSWNRPHKVTVGFDMRFDKDAPRGWKWLMNQSGVNVYMLGQSGRAYTPYDITNDHAVGLPNSKNGPFQVTTDLKFNHWFKLFARRFDVSVQGTNIFNNLLVYRVDRVDGGGYVWGEGQFDPAHVRAINDFTRLSQVDDPSNYSAGAQWRAQLDVDF